MHSRLFSTITYEFKCALRSELFLILAFLSIVGVVAYQFTPLSGGIQSASDLLRVSVDKLSRVLPSSLAYGTAYYYNLVQLLLVAAFITNDARLARHRSLELLFTRPVSNAELVWGGFIGKLLVFTLVNGLTFGLAMVINFSFYPRAFLWWAYPFYWLTFNLPALVYLLGLAYLVCRVVKHQGGSFFLLLLFTGFLTLQCAGWQNGLFDPCARWIPNLFSDFTGHVHPWPYLLQRGFTLLLGFFFLTLSQLPYPRIPNGEYLSGKVVRMAGIALLLVLAVGFAFVRHHEHARELRAAYRAVYAKHGGETPARVVSHDVFVEETSDGGIAVSSDMVVENRTGKRVPLLLYLNPGLEVSALHVDGQACSFKREHQVIVLERQLLAGERARLSLQYAGKVSPAICFTDTGDDRYFSPGVNQFGIFRFGFRPVICEQSYKLLTPESLWYPVCVPPHGRNGGRDVNFSRYSLHVKHDPRLTAISQGAVREEGKGETRFTFKHDLPGITLCVGRYAQRNVEVDSIRMALYYLPEHEYLLKKYDAALQDSIPGSIRTIKDVNFAHHYSTTRNYQYQKYVAKMKGLTHAKEITQEYPYEWFYLVETPCHFHAFPHHLQPTGERVQNGLVLLPEKMYAIQKYPASIPNGINDMGIYMAFIGLENDINTIVNERSYDFRFLLRGQTSFFSDPKHPSTYSIFTHLAGSTTLQSDYKATDYPAIAYLKNHSLQEALLDTTLPLNVVSNILHKKTGELHALLMPKLKNKERFKHFFLDFSAKHPFQETTTNEFFQHFRDTFGFQLDSIMEKWYTSKPLPIFKIEHWKCFNIKEKKAPFSYYLHQFEILNIGEVAGIIRIDTKQWEIPPHTRKRITTKSRDTRIFFPLSQHFPNFQTIQPEQQAISTLDTTTSEIVMDSSSIHPATQTDAIIVDNEDPGFRIVKKENWFTALWQDSISPKIYYDYMTSKDKWVPIIREHFYGHPVRSAYVKTAGEGRQQVEWKASLPHEGKYELFFYYTTFMPPKRTFSHPLLNKNTKKEKAQDLHFIIHDGVKTQAVSITTGRNDHARWVSLGTFDCKKQVSVILKDQSLNSEEPIIADAVKWRKTQEEANTVRKKQ